MHKFVGMSVRVCMCVLVLFDDVPMCVSVAVFV